MHLLFWLSLIPFVTGWMGENHFQTIPVAFYGIVLLFSAIAYFILTHSLLAHHGKDSTLAIAISQGFKEKVSLAVYAAAIPLAFVNSWFACGLYGLVPGMWLIPDPRIEKTLIQ